MVGVAETENLQKSSLLAFVISCCSENVRDLVERLVSRTLYSFKIITVPVNRPSVFASGYPQ